MPRLTTRLTDAESGFFEYVCDACAAPLCERETLYALALGYEEDTLCCDCLSEQESLPLDALLSSLQGYIQSRECFQKPWKAFEQQAQECPLLLRGTCVCATVLA
jgi:hypothetical protein